MESESYSTTGDVTKAYIVSSSMHSSCCYAALATTKFGDEGARGIGVGLKENTVLTTLS